MRTDVPCGLRAYAELGWYGFLTLGYGYVSPAHAQWVIANGVIIPPPYFGHSSLLHPVM